MTTAQQHMSRALTAWRLTELGCGVRDIRVILRCSGPEEARRLLARGRRLSKQAILAGDWPAPRHD